MASAFAAAILMLGTVTGAAGGAAQAPLHPETTERGLYRAQIRNHLLHRDFDALERIGRDLLADDPRFSSGVSKLAEFYNAFEPANDAGPDGPDGKLAVFADWAKERPDSHWPTVGFSVVELWIAEHARGGAWARDVSPEQWHEHDRHIKKAMEWGMKALADGTRDPELLAHMIGVCRNANCPMERADGWLASAIAMNPNYESAYVTMANALLPRWRGSAEEFVAFAERASDENKALGNIAYACVATVGLAIEGGGLRATFPGLRWERILDGLRETDKRFPDSARTYHLMARLARLYGDRAVAREALTRLGDRLDSDAAHFWTSTAEFREARAWAFQDDASAAAASSSPGPPQRQ